MSSKIQTCGSYSPDDGYSFSIAFGDGPCMTLEGLTEKDIYEIASCSCAMLPEGVFRTLLEPATMLKYSNKLGESNGTLI